MSKEFGMRLRETRLRKGFTGEQLGNLAEISKQAMSSYETGRREPKLKTLGLFAKALGVTADYLIGLSSENVESVVKINTHGNPMPEKHGDWTDLSTAEDVQMKAGEIRLISLGISTEFPEGYYAKLLPRSSTPKKWGIMLANGVGIIDHEYNGDEDVWQFLAYATRDTSIPKGTRIAQFSIVRQEEQIHLEKVDSLNNPERGGFGSTGS